MCVHSHMNSTLGIETVKRVGPFNLFWFEEAVSPSKYREETEAITDSTNKTTVDGESIFGREALHR